MSARRDALGSRGALTGSGETWCSERRPKWPFQGRYRTLSPLLPAFTRTTALPTLSQTRHDVEERGKEHRGGRRGYRRTARQTSEGGTSHEQPSFRWQACRRDHRRERSHAGPHSDWNNTGGGQGDGEGEGAAAVDDVEGCGQQGVRDLSALHPAFDLRLPFAASLPPTTMSPRSLMHRLSTLGARLHRFSSCGFRPNDNIQTTMS